MNTKTTIKITNLEIKLLNEIVNQMYDGGGHEHSDFILSKLSRMHTDYEMYRHLMNFEKGVMSSLIKKKLVYQYEYHEANDIETAMVLPTKEGIFASIIFHLDFFGNQSSEFKNQFGFDTDLEYIENLQTWYEDRTIHISDLRSIEFSKFNFDLSYKEAYDMKAKKDSITYKGLENELNNAFNKLVENDEDKMRVEEATKAHEEFKTLAKRPIFSGLADLNNDGGFRWTDDLVAEFAKICSNKSRLKQYGLLNADIAQLITTEDKMRAFKEACMQ